MNAPTGKLAPESGDQAAFKVVGTRPVRPDGIDKVTGKAVYSPDFVAPGMLYGAILRSPHAHARIRSIDTASAAALPGVKAVITHADFPQVPGTSLEGGDNLQLIEQCMASGKALFDGHAVAAVAATSQAIADAALALIAVDYEVLAPVITVEQAMAADAPLVHDGWVRPGAPEGTAPSNLGYDNTSVRGDVDTALASADVVLERTFSSQPLHQGYIEPHACVAVWNEDGQGQIWASSQGHFMIRSIVAGALGIPLADLRVTALEIGGGFGGKTKVYIEPVAMVLSRKAGRPVRLAMNRAEVFKATGPVAGGVYQVKIGAKNDGTLVGADLDLVYNTGAYLHNDAAPGLRSAFAPYKVPAFRARGRVVLSNMAARHAYRAPGAPQAAFGFECLLDELAEQLGIDPVDLRLRNVCRPGDPSFDGLPHGKIGFAETLEAVKAHPHWNAPVPEGAARGFACGSWGNYGGPSSAEVSIADDGTVAVCEGNPDIGGSRAAMAMMAAETLGIAYEKVRVTIPDTGSVGYCMLTGGSRVSYATGMAVINAINGCIDELKKRAALAWGVEPAEVEWRDGAAWCGSGGNAGESLSLARIAATANFMGGPISASGTVNAQGYLPGFGAHICDIKVDRETGVSEIVRYTAFQDVGRAIHPDYVEGQLQGGAVQGIGWALNEEYVFDGVGRVDNPGFLDYRMPVCSDLPMIEAVMVEVPNPNHPYGIKGVGESPIVPPLATVCNAVSRAVGKRLTDLPLKPSTVHAAIAAG